VISGTPATSVVAGKAYSFQPSASDADGNSLSFSVSNKPAWAAFSIATGSLTGTPTSTQVGTYNNVVISVSDGLASVSLSPFAITVTAPPNTPPVISGTPAKSVTAGSAYSFTPTASDANGDTLAFSIQNKPTWATFSSSNGSLSGTPVAANVGTTSNIVISVSDGKGGSASLPAFSLVVNAAPSTGGSVTISWTAPTVNVDGSPLTDLAGFNVLYGTSPTTMNRSTQVPGAGATSTTISGLASGTWYFSVGSYTNTGSQSVPSTPATAVVP
jgi:hypothetical protein